MNTIFNVIFNRPIKKSVVAKKGKVIIDLNSPRAMISEYEFCGEVTKDVKIGIFKEAIQILTTEIKIEKKRKGCSYSQGYVDCDACIKNGELPRALRDQASSDLFPTVYTKGWKKRCDEEIEEAKI